MSVRIVERMSLTGSRVDRDRGVIYGVRICGSSSQNGNDYSRSSFGDGSQYEGRHVYLNHGRERRTEDKVGWFSNVTFDNAGLPRGDLNVLTSHPMGPVLLEMAERNPALVGMSHVAQCRTSRGTGGRTRVEAVEKVESIDIVAEPATTSSLFESLMSALPPRPFTTPTRTAPKGRPMSTLRTVLERKLTGRARRVFEAAAGADLLDTTADEPGYTSSPDEAVRLAIGSAGSAIWASFLRGDVELDAALSKLRKLGRAFATVAEPAADVGSSPILDNDLPLGEARGWSDGGQRLRWEDGGTPTLVSGRLGWNPEAGPTLTEGRLGWSMGAAPAAKPTFDKKSNRLRWQD